MLTFGDKIKLDLEKLFNSLATDKDKKNGYVQLNKHQSIMVPKEPYNYYWIDVNGFLIEGYKNKDECLFFREIDDEIYIIGNDIFSNDEAPLIVLTKKQFETVLVL